MKMKKNSTGISGWLSLALTIALLFMTTASAAGVLDPRARVAAGRLAATSRAGGGGDEATHLPLVVKIADESAMELLKEADAVVLGRRAMIVLCSVPLENVRMIEDSESIVSASVNTCVNVDLDVARPLVRADEVALGAGLPSGLTGKGVVAGFCDTGFDPLHSAFAGRVKGMRVYDTIHGRAYTPDASNSEESLTHYHATHVAGILAGGHTRSPYHGVAVDADIFATMSDLSDVGILAGIDDILEYAASQGKPAVVNISLSSIVGPRDGTSLFNQYTDLQAADGAVIVVSAGNSGQRPCSLRAVLGEDGGEPSLSTCLRTWTFTDVTGPVDIWGGDDSPLEVTFEIWDAFTGRVIGSHGPLRPDGSGVVSLDADWRQFANCFSGRLDLAGEMGTENRRFNVYMECEYSSRLLLADGTGRYRLILTVGGRKGNTVDMFCDGNELQFSALNGTKCRPGNADCSINELACGRNVIAVGMVADRSEVPLLGGDSYQAGFDEGVISPHSSYGTTADGRTLPHISAPGNLVVSAGCGPYIAANPGVLRVAAATPRATGGDDLWIATGGTSMSAPMVAGIVATWMEADPNLTVERVRAILRATARNDMADRSDPRYGSGGVVDALAGAKAVALGSELEIVSDEAGSAIVFDGRSVMCSGAEAIELFTASGLRIAAVSGARMYCETLAPGVYIVRAVTATDVVTRRIALLR